MYVINYLVMSMREHMHDLRMRWLAEHAGTLGPSVHRQSVARFRKRNGYVYLL